MRSCDQTVVFLVACALDVADRELSQQKRLNVALGLGGDYLLLQNGPPITTVADEGMGQLAFELSLDLSYMLFQYLRLFFRGKENQRG